VNKKGKWRLCWSDPVTRTSGKGAFLFDRPAAARRTVKALRKVFPMNRHWLEDKDGNRIDMDPAPTRGLVHRVRALFSSFRKPRPRRFGLGRRSG
jgi:hypothetical protein